MAETFTFSSKFGEAVAFLTDEQKAEYYTAICEYGLFGKEPTDVSPVVSALFAVCAPDIDNSIAYRRGGSKGGSKAPSKDKAKGGSKGGTQAPLASPLGKGASEAALDENGKGGSSPNLTKLNKLNKPNKLNQTNKGGSGRKAAQEKSAAPSPDPKAKKAYCQNPLCGSLKPLWKDSMGKYHCDSCLETFTAEEVL